MAESRLVVRNFGPDGVESARSETFEVGEKVAFDGAALTAPRGLTVNGARCDGTFPLAIDRETDIVLTIAGDRCAVAVVAVHVPGQPTHED